MVETWGKYKSIDHVEIYIFDNAMTPTVQLTLFIFSFCQQSLKTYDVSSILLWLKIKSTTLILTNNIIY